MNNDESVQLLHLRSRLDGVYDHSLGLAAAVRRMNTWPAALEHVDGARVHEAMATD
jgi:hypothetical protein